MFCFNIVLYVHTGLANFDFNQCYRIQYLQNVVFGFEKGSIGQNSSSSDSHHSIKKCPCSKVSHYPPTEGIPPPKKKTIWKTLCIAYINVNITLNSHTYK